MRCPIKFGFEQAERFATSIKCAERLLQTLCTLARTSGVKDDSAIVYHFIRLHIRHTCVIGSLMALVTTVLCEPIGNQLLAETLSVDSEAFSGNA